LGRWRGVLSIPRLNGLERSKVGWMDGWKSDCV
jgi:hypothetical protein